MTRVSVSPVSGGREKSCCLPVSSSYEKARAAGRGGVGAVMGSKNLKAIAARGDLPIKPADEEKLNVIKDRVRKKIEDNGIEKALHNYGTAVLINIINENYVLPDPELPDRSLCKR